MRIGIVALVIAIAMMLATIQSAAAAPVGAFVAKGTVQYESGETCPYGWNLEMENLDHDLDGEPWHSTTAWFPPGVDYFQAGKTVADSDRIQVTITSPDGSYSGTNTMVASEAWNGANVIINVVVYEVPEVTETFTKFLPEGWNLISLPLAPLKFADATTMAPGTGYFVHVTTAGDWVYEGTPETSTSPGLKAGLNMIGVPNCTKTVSAAMGTADYRYVARWDAVDQKYEVYNPNAPAASFYGFTEMTAGEGYFVSAKSDDVDWTVNCLS
jgi:hypothetical protein